MIDRMLLRKIWIFVIEIAQFLLHKIEFPCIELIQKMNRPGMHPDTFQLFLKDAEAASQTYNSNRSSSGNTGTPEYI